MNCWTHNFQMKARGDCIYLTGLFDIHGGTKACDIERFKEDVKIIQDTPNAYAFLGGDLCEFINPSDKRFDVQTIAQTHMKKLDSLAMSQANEMIDILRPIQKKLLFTLTGNHEEKIRKVYNNDITNYVAMALGIPDLGLIGVVRLTFSRSGLDKNRASRALVLFAAHGFGSAAKYGGKINRIIDLMQWIEADIYWCGHVHAKGFAQSVKLELSRQDVPFIKQKNRIAILGGSYLRVYVPGMNSYGEKVGFMPTPLGCIPAKITPFPGQHWVDGRKIENQSEIQINTTIDVSGYDINMPIESIKR